MAKVKANIEMKGDTMFRLYSRKAEQALKDFKGDLQGQIDKMTLSGMSAAAIMEAVEKSLDNATDSFGGLKSAIRGIQNDLAGGIGQIASNSALPDTETYAWVLDPSAKEHCDDCVARAQEDAKTLAEWETIGLPGLGNTECDGYCKCSLIPDKGDAVDLPSTELPPEPLADAIAVKDAIAEIADLGAAKLVQKIASTPTLTADKVSTLTLTKVAPSELAELAVSKAKAVDPEIAQVKALYGGKGAKGAGSKKDIALTLDYLKGQGSSLEILLQELDPKDPNAFKAAWNAATQNAKVALSEETILAAKNLVAGYGLSESQIESVAQKIVASPGGVKGWKKTMKGLTLGGKKDALFDLLGETAPKVEVVAPLRAPVEAVDAAKKLTDEEWKEVKRAWAQEIGADLERYVKEAVQQIEASKKAGYSLTISPEAMAILKAYTGNSYKRFNSALAKMQRIPGFDLARIELNRGLSTLPIHAEKEVFRGIAKQGLKYEVGKDYVFEAFQSTSYSRAMAESWGNRKTLFIIEHKNGRLIEHFSVQGKAEREVLLPAGSRMRLLKKEIDASGQEIFYWKEL